MCVHTRWCVGGRGYVWPTLLSTVDMTCHYALKHMLTLEHTHTYTHTHMQTSSVVICQCFNWLPCKHNGPSPPTPTPCCSSSDFAALLVGELGPQESREGSRTERKSLLRSLQTML